MEGFVDEPTYEGEEDPGNETSDSEMSFIDIVTDADRAAAHESTIEGAMQDEEEKIRKKRKIMGSDDSEEEAVEMPV